MCLKEAKESKPVALQLLPKYAQGAATASGDAFAYASKKIRYRIDQLHAMQCAAAAASANDDPADMHGAADQNFDSESTEPVAASTASEKTAEC